MLRSHSFIFNFTLAIVASFACMQSHAVQRTHVSAAFGSDANTASNCTADAPCRFFQAAMSVTDNNGEVVVLDSGGYGAVTITQSVSLTAPTGVYAGISVFPGTNGVTIATPGVNVVLRGLTINGQGGNNGINMTAGNRLTVENCVISNLNQSGIVVDTTATVRVTDTVVRDNGSNGIFLQNGAKGTITRTVASGHVNDTAIKVAGTLASTTTTADIADSTLDGGFYGVHAYSFNATAAVTVSVRDSRAVRNIVYGLYMQSTAGAAVSISASNNMVSGNARGISVFGAGAKVWASGNTVSNNTSSGLENGGAVFETAGNNAVRNNGANVGIITAVATQ